MQETFSFAWCLFYKDTPQSTAQLPAEHEEQQQATCTTPKACNKLEILCALQSALLLISQLQNHPDTFGSWWPVYFLNDSGIQHINSLINAQQQDRQDPTLMVVLDNCSSTERTELAGAETCPCCRKERSWHQQLGVLLLQHQQDVTSTITLLLEHLPQYIKPDFSDGGGSSSKPGFLQL